MDHPFCLMSVRSWMKRKNDCDPNIFDNFLKVQEIATISTKTYGIYSLPLHQSVLYTNPCYNNAIHKSEFHERLGKPRCI